MWLKTYVASTGTQSGRVNVDHVLWFEAVPGSGGTFGVIAFVIATSAAQYTRSVTPGYPYATNADALAAIDDFILNGN